MSMSYRAPGITNTLIANVIRYAIYDTKKYRYRYAEWDGSIERIELDKLDTTEALTGWETVARY